MTEEIKKLDEEIHNLEHKMDDDYKHMVDHLHEEEKEMDDEIRKNQEILLKYIKDNHIGL